MGERRGGGGGGAKEEKKKSHYVKMVTNFYRTHCGVVDGLKGAGD